jgi:hypothetical protein
MECSGHTDDGPLNLAMVFKARFAGNQVFLSGSAEQQYWELGMVVAGSVTIP